MTTIEQRVHAMAAEAKQASRALAQLSSAQKTTALQAMAVALRAATSVILSANNEDMEAARIKNLSSALLDRLLLNDKRLQAMAESVEAIAMQPDPIGTVLASWSRPNGLSITKVRVPLGVIGIIYEARPNVTADAVALCLKSGNAAVLRSGSESLRSSMAIMQALHQGLAAAGIPVSGYQLINTRDRAAVGAMLTAADSIDVLIPRGGRSLIERVSQESRIPVIKHLDGLCHTYIDVSANPEQASRVTLNAKMRRTGICGATETILVHQEYPVDAVRAVVAALLDSGCEVRGDAGIAAVDTRVVAASEKDWHTEYLEAIVSVKYVASVADAVTHINHYGSHHTDAIIAEDADAVAYFLNNVESGIVMHNTSTQFADGGEFGFGAEIGISTGKLHVRGPVGAEHLTTTQYRVTSHGAIRP